jgi:putative membrane protein
MAPTATFDLAKRAWQCAPLPRRILCRQPAERLPMESLTLWIKALHLIVVMTWMAGMLYLPRLFVYHASAAVGSELSETLKVMEKRLLRIIVTPSMILVWITGPILAYRMGYFEAGWLHAKIALVLVMSAIHGYLAGRVRVFAQDRNQRPAGFYRILNEVPAVLLVLIVFLVVVKPF